MSDAGYFDSVSANLKAGVVDQLAGVKEFWARFSPLMHTSLADAQPSLEERTGLLAVNRPFW